jgi:hypothetical protein
MTLEDDVEVGETLDTQFPSFSWIACDTSFKSIFRYAKEMYNCVASRK